MISATSRRGEAPGARWWAPGGRPTTGRRTSKTREPDSEARAYERALRLLTVRPRGRAELTRALTERGFTREVALGAADRLQAEAWLDDLAAARSVTRVKAARYGRARLERELAARGFSRETILQALAAELPDREEAALARAFERLWARHAKLALPDRRRKVREALARRGFASEAISAIIRSSHEVR